MPINIGTGAVHQEADDIGLPGRHPLTWTRRYNSNLVGDKDSPLGPGWSSPVYAALTRIGKDYHYLTPTGGTVIFPDPQDSVDHSGTIRDRASFNELSRRNRLLCVTNWSSPGKVTRRYFHSDRNGAWWPLRLVEDAAGEGLELAWDDKGLLKGLRQKREKRTLVFDHTAAGRVASIAFRHADGRQTGLCRYEYDSKGRLAAAFDALGHATRYEYTSEGRLSRQLDKDGAVFTYKYDDKGRCVRFGGLDNYNLKVLRFLDHVRWTEVTNSYGDTRRYEWLAGGQIIQEIDPVGGIKKTEYDAHGRITAIIGPMGDKTTYEFDEAGNKSKRTDPLGRVTTWEYDADHQPTCEIDAMGGRWENRYDGAGRITAAIDPLGNAHTVQYDPSGDPILYRKPTGVVSKRVYAANGDLVESTDWEDRKTTFVRDEFGRTIERTDPDGMKRAIRYDAVGQAVAMADSQGRKEQFEFDAIGNVTRWTGTRAPEIRYRFGKCRRILEKRIAGSEPIRYKWGSEPDRLEAVVNERGETYAFGYDAADHVIRETGFDGLALTLLYDLAGRCIRKTDALGQIVAWKFDLAGQLASETLPGGEQSEFAYDDSGNIIGAKNPTSEITIKRDALGRIMEETQNGFAIRKEYATDPLVRRLETDAGIHIGFGYDGNGLVTSMDASGLGNFTYGRNARGQAAKVDIPGERTLVQTWDSRGRLLHQALAETPSGSISGSAIDRTFAYGENDSLLSIVDGPWGKTGYAYDESRRLVGYAAGPERTTYGLDASGDPVSILEGEKTIPVVNAQGGAVLAQGATRYEYDGAGRLAIKLEPAGAGPERKWQYAWDAKDRLRAVTTPEGAVWEYAYDPFGRRVSKRGPDRDIRYIWNGPVLLHELEKGRPDRTWGFEPNRFKPVFKIEDGKVLSIITDHLGTPRELIDSYGKVAWSMIMNPRGAPIVGKGDGNDCPIRFQGQYFDAETGLYYNNNRYYDPGTGRYISKDPIRLYGGIDQYQYGKNPIETLDPLGLCTGGSGPGDQGRAGVERAKDDIIAAGGKILGEETTIDAGGVRTRPDLYVELPSGERIFVEVKTGPNAGHTENQTAAFPVIASTGGVPAGSRAEKAGLTPGQPIGPTRVVTVHYPWPLP